MGLSEQQVAIVKNSWPEIISGDDGVQLGHDMFARYFNDNPEMTHVFGYTGKPELLRHNAKLREHGKKIVDQIGKAVAECHDQAKMKATLRELGNRHKGFGPIKAEHFPALGDAFVDAVKAKCRGVDSTTWYFAYRAIADAMVEGLRS